MPFCSVPDIFIVTDFCPSTGAIPYVYESLGFPVPSREAGEEEIDPIHASFPASIRGCVILKKMHGFNNPILSFLQALNQDSTSFTRFSITVSTAFHVG